MKKLQVGSEAPVELWTFDIAAENKKYHCSQKKSPPIILTLTKFPKILKKKIFTPHVRFASKITYIFIEGVEFVAGFTP